MVIFCYLVQPCPHTQPTFPAISFLFSDFFFAHFPTRLLFFYLLSFSFLFFTHLLSPNTFPLPHLKMHVRFFLLSPTFFFPRFQTSVTSCLINFNLSSEIVILTPNNFPTRVFPSVTRIFPAPHFSLFPACFLAVQINSFCVFISVGTTPSSPFSSGCSLFPLKNFTRYFICVYFVPENVSYGNESTNFQHLIAYRRVFDSTTF